MKALSVLFFSLIISQMALAQSQSKNKPNAATLEVTGNGEVKTQPDQTVLYVQAWNENEVPGKAAEAVTKKVDDMVKKLNDAGFKRDEIKISQYSLQENTQWRNGEMIREGYRASQNLEITFASNRERMGKATKVISNFTEGISFSFSFSLSEKKQKEVREEAIRKAIQDAREKAAVIARSAGIQLGSIANIRYGNPENNYQPVYRSQMQEAAMMKSSDGGDFPATDIKDLKINDSVEIIWHIE
jgi:uncharacterized protein YggE